MSERYTQAGGCFLMGSILAGAAGGAVIGSPMSGILFGTAAGIAAAGLIWLRDRRRR